MTSPFFKADMRRFGLSRLLLAMTIVSVGIGLANLYGWVMYLLMYGVFGFWFGTASFFLCDWMDSRPPSQKHWFANLMNIVGMFLVVISTGLVIFIGLLFLYGKIVEWVS